MSSSSACVGRRNSARNCAGERSVTSCVADRHAVDGVGFERVVDVDEDAQLGDLVVVQLRTQAVEVLLEVADVRGDRAFGMARSAARPTRRCAGTRVGGDRGRGWRRVGMDGEGSIAGSRIEAAMTKAWPRVRHRSRRWRLTLAGRGGGAPAGWRRRVRGGRGGGAAGGGGGGGAGGVLSAMLMKAAAVGETAL